jgi:sec-independent protein translocase protein TatC
MIEAPEDPNQSLIEHLTELRLRLINSGYGILAGFLACWAFSDRIFEVIRRPIQKFLPTGGLIFTAPMDKFLAYVKVSFLAGVVISCPIWILQIWKFVAPGLYQHERRYAVSFMAFGTILFMIGVSFVYFVVFPMAFQFLLGFGTAVDKPMITIDAYLSFFTNMTLVFGLAFEMPLVLALLGLLGIIDHHLLMRYRRYAIVAMAILAAIVTPPDAISMMMMLVPLVLLYEISIWVVKFVGARKQTSSPTP